MESQHQNTDYLYGTPLLYLFHIIEITIILKRKFPLYKAPPSIRNFGGRSNDPSAFLPIWGGVVPSLGTISVPATTKPLLRIPTPSPRLDLVQLAFVSAHGIIIDPSTTIRPTCSTKPGKKMLYCNRHLFIRLYAHTATCAVCGATFIAAF